MKPHKLDWQKALGMLESWNSLPLSSRKLYLNLRQGVNRLAESQDTANLTQAGLLQQNHPSSDEFLAGGPTQAFFEFVHGSYQCQVFDQPTLAQFNLYAAASYHRLELDALLTTRRGPTGVEAVFDRVASEDWLQEILELNECLNFEIQHLVRRERPFLMTPRRLKELQRLIRHLLERGAPASLPALLESFDRETLCSILPAGFRYLALYPGLDRKTLLPLIGLWPRAVERIAAPAPAPPQPVASVRAEYSNPFLMDDLTQVLIACANQPLRIRSADGQLFARDYSRLEDALAPMPDWVQGAMDLDAENRMNVALAYGESFGFIQLNGKQGRDLRLESTPQASQWLGEAAAARLRHFLDHFRQSQSLPWQIEVRDASPSPDLLAAVADSFFSLERSCYYDFDGFVQYHQAQTNPFLKLREKRSRFSIQLDWRLFPSPNAETLEKIWANILIEYLRQRLLPLAGIKLARGKKGKLLFALTEIGAYLLGESAQVQLPSLDQGQLLVQANFEVVFLSPSPLAEAEIGRFAERIGQKVGAVFRIDRDSVYSAVASGITSEHILSTLRRLSSKDIPANVAREIEGWEGQSRRVTSRPAQLVECPDPETAGRVRAAGGKKARLLNPTTVELLPGAQKGTIQRRLRKIGIQMDWKGK